MGLVPFFFEQSEEPFWFSFACGDLTIYGTRDNVLLIRQDAAEYDNSEEMAMLFDLKKEGYFYTRLQNPTNDAVAKKIAQLEGGVGAVLTSSGQAANFYAVFNICEAGDHIVTWYCFHFCRRGMFFLPQRLQAYISR